MDPVVPKFASFRSRVSSPKEPRDPGRKTREKEEENRHGGQHRNERRRHGQERREKSALPHQSKQERHPRSGNKSSNQPQRNINVEDDPNVFIVDRRGDSDNLSYGTNPKRSVPEYRAPSKTHPLGGGDVHDSDAFWRPRILSLRNKRLESDLSGESTYVKAESPSDIPEDVLSRDFLEFPPSKRRKRSQDVTSEDNQVAGDEEDLGIEDGETQTKYLSSDLPTPENILDQVNSGSELRRQYTSLSSRTKNHPDDVHAWLDFIDFQRSWVRQVSEKDKSKPTAAEISSIAQVRISLYEEALTKIQSDYNARETLLLGLLDEGSKVWESKKLLSQWETLVKANPDYLDLRTKYIETIQTRLSFFTFSKCLKQYGDFLSTLLQSRNISPEERIRRQLNTFLHASSMIRDAGYKELSRCLWQAIIEINIFTPLGIGGDFQKRLSLFEKFWDNEFLRVGEDGAPGWARTSQDAEIAHSGHTSKINPPSTDRYGQPDLVSSWLQGEIKMSKMSTQPARTMDEPSDTDDPYRVVLYADIEPFLFPVESKHQPALVDAFLCFHQFPGVSGIKSLHRKEWWHSPLLLKPLRLHHSVMGLLDVQSVVTTSETLFNEFQSIFSPDSGNEHDLIALNNLEFTFNVLHLLTKSYELAVLLREYTLAAAVAKDKAKAIKRAKTMLKENQSDLVLYNAYGLIEMKTGNDQAGTHVFPVAIQKGLSFQKESERLNVLLLHRTWTWQALVQGDLTTARSRLHKVAETGSVQENLQNFRSKAIHHSLPTSAALASELLALSSYIPIEGDSADLASALETFHSESAILATLDPFEASSYAVEHLHQAKATLISYHMQYQGVFSPTLIRTALRPSLASFPNNTMFLNLYAENERRFRIDDRVRHIANEILNTAPNDANDAKPSIIPWCFAIKSELERGKLAASGATVHSVRAAFERAVTNDNSIDASSIRRAGPGPATSSLIWSAYLLWEVEVANDIALNERQSVKSQHREQRKRHKEEKRKGNSAVDSDRVAHERKIHHLQKAKHVWLRGVNALPWVKDFVLLGIRLLQECLSVEEVRGYVNMMGDKGLRVHIDFEDMVD